MSQFWKEFRKGLKDFGSHVNLFANTVFLLIVYIVGVGLAAFWTRLFRRPLKDNEPLNADPTYWLDSDLGTSSVEDYYRQF